jgi:ribonuclease P protein component
MVRKTGRFRRADRVLASRDFDRALSSGKHTVSECFVVVVASDREAPRAAAAAVGPRLGITVGRRVGNAVIRNRVKRNVREWFRGSRGTLPRGSDVIVIARHPARGLSGADTARALDAGARDSCASGRVGSSAGTR